MQAKKYTTENHPNEYLDYLYSEPEVEGKVPLVLYIHGAGCRGNEVDVLRDNEGLKEVIKYNKSKCVIAAPQCHWNYWFTGFEILSDFIDTMRHSEKVDISRVYICGSSMGGYTTWQLCLSHTDWFAAAMPICGGGMYWAASLLKNLPIWAFHGALDTIVLPEETIHMVKVINSCGGNARLTVFPKADHNAWTPALSSPETWEWAWKQKRDI